MEEKLSFNLIFVRKENFLGALDSIGCKLFSNYIVIMLAGKFNQLLGEV